MLIGIIGEEIKILDGVPAGDEHEEDNTYPYETKSRCWAGDAIPFPEPHERQHGNEEDYGECANGAEGVRETFVREEFRHQHHEEPPEDEEESGEFGVVGMIFESSTK